MRTVVLLDKLIDKDEALNILNDFGEFYKEHTGIECTWWVERRDFSQVPTVPDSDGDLKPTYQYRQSLNKSVHDRYGDYGTDNVIMWVHEDNFLFKGIWGTAWSYVHYKYNFLLCRWDKDNPVNTWNTLFHELEHPADTLILKELGIEIDGIIEEHFNVSDFDYDRDYVHGGSPLFKYIGQRGYVRDSRMLELLKPYLQGAYNKRKEKHFAPYNKVLWQIITILKGMLRI